jgi:hypothetical protein
LTTIAMRSSRIAALLAMLAGGCPAAVWAETGNVAADHRVVVKKPWIRLTGPGGEAVHINVEQVTSVRPDAEMPGANTQLDLASGKFQRVQEDAYRVMQLIVGLSDGRENDGRPSAALICAGSM